MDFGFPVLHVVEDSTTQNVYVGKLKVQLLMTQL